MHWCLLLVILPYLYLIFKIYYALIRIKPFVHSVNPEIFVSVIVACRNEEQNLPVLLSGFSGQSYDPRLFEVIIVDDNSTDSTFQIASGYTGIQNLKVLKSLGRGKKKAIRTGIKESQGSLVITTDADCTMGRNWLKVITAYQVEKNPDMILASVKLEPGKGFFRYFEELEFLSLQGITAGSSALGNPVMCNGANLAFLKDSYFGSAGDLHDELVSGDDVFLLHSIKRDSGKRIIWLESAEAMITTTGTGDLYSFLFQRARWISKTSAYKDRFTLSLAIVTIVTIILQVSLLIAAILNLNFLLVYLAALFLKSIPDFFILNNTSGRYGRKSLMRWILPSEILYPFYILAVIIFCIRYRDKWRF